VPYELYGIWYGDGSSDNAVNTIHVNVEETFSNLKTINPRLTNSNGGAFCGITTGFSISNTTPCGVSTPPGVSDPSTSYNVE
jgi:chorismate synthase